MTFLQPLRVPPSQRPSVIRFVNPGGSPHRVLITGGLALVFLLLVVSAMSESLAAGQPIEQQPVALFVALMMIAGGVYTASAVMCSRMSGTKKLRVWVVLVAIGLRLTMLSGTPILEDDPYRYLWDGALVAHGLNPYRHAPGAFQGGASGDPSLAARLAEKSNGILERVNYPWLRTLYPTLAQAAFGLAHCLAPWSLPAWRMVVAAFDLAAFYMLCRLGVPAVGLLTYGWNPLLVKEVYNSAHVDALMLPFLLATAVLLRRERPIFATAAVGVASCIKLWPVLLMPIVWRRLTRRRLVLLSSLLLSAGALAAALLPVVLSGLDRSSGLAAYGRYWEMNDALFVMISWIFDALTSRLAFSPDLAALIPRMAAALMAVGGIGWLAWRRDLMVGRQLLAATTLVILLSPTQFPWYYLWLLPFLALHPHPALILYAALLPLYYLRPLMAFHGYGAAFDHGVVWIQHGPVIVWLLLDWVVKGGLGPAGRSAAAGTERPLPGLR